MNRFSVPPLHSVTRQLADVAGGRFAPDAVITGARLLSTYSERILAEREVWLYRGRIAAVMPAGQWHRSGDSGAAVHDAAGGILAPGLVDPHLHIERSMMTACAYAEAALLHGTTTIFCDSHLIAMVCSVAGVDRMVGDASRGPVDIYISSRPFVPPILAPFETSERVYPHEQR